MGQVRVLIVDDFEPWRNAIRSILTHDSRIRVVGECSNGADAVEKCRELHPDLVLLDVELPGMNGFVTAQRISEISPATKVLFLTANSSFEVVRASLKHGGGLVTKAEASRELLRVVRSVAQNEPSIRWKFLEGDLPDLEET